ncbi:MAG: response regulator [Hyphomonadaceae bacterium]
MSLTALIADDHGLFRDGLKLLLLDVLGVKEVIEAETLDDAIERVGAAGAIDLMLVDLRMPGMAGVESLTALIDGFPDSKILVVSAWEERADILAALDVGVHGYIPKSLANTQIVEAIRHVMAGGIFVPPSLGRRDGPPPRGTSAPLSGQWREIFTQRQRDVIGELRKGRSSKEIARTLDIAEGTVKIHLAAIYRILAVRTRAEAIVKLNSAEMN